MAWNNDRTHRFCVRVAKTSVTANTASQVVQLVNTDQTPSEFWDYVVSHGGDIRFTKDTAGAQPIACEVVNFDRRNKKMEIYFGPVTLGTAANNAFYLWCGGTPTMAQPVRTANTDSDGFQGSNYVWTPYEAVYHFQDSVNDSCAASHNFGSATGTINYVTTIGGGKGLLRVSTEDPLRTTAMGHNISNNYVQFWWHDKQSSTNYTQIVGTYPYPQHSLGVNQTLGILRPIIRNYGVSTGCTFVQFAEGGDTVSTLHMYQVLFSTEADKCIRFYLDSASAKATGTVTQQSSASSMPVQIFGYWKATSFAEVTYRGAGILDELRIAKQTFGEAHIQFQAKLQTSAEQVVWPTVLTTALYGPGQTMYLLQAHKIPFRR